MKSRDFSLIVREIKRILISQARLDKAAVIAFLKTVDGPSLALIDTSTWRETYDSTF